MMKKTSLLFLVVVGLLLAPFASLALAALGGVTDPIALQSLAEVRRVTAKNHDVSVAEANGYVSTVNCVAAPPGGMGIHYIDFALASDLAVDPLRPEALLYVPTANGVKLVAVEYFVPALVITPSGPMPWFDPAPPPYNWFNPAPVVLGQTMDGPMAGHDPGMPWHYDLHVWVWQGNPAGVFAQFNPSVRCP
jgi:hypothetical protein